MKKAIVEEINRLSGELKRPAEEITKEIKQLVEKEGRTELAATAIWKSKNISTFKPRGGGDKSMYKGLLIAKQPPRKVTTRKGAMRVCNLDWVVSINEAYEIRAMTLWAGQCDHAVDLVEGKVYSFVGGVPLMDSKKSPGDRVPGLDQLKLADDTTGFTVESPKGFISLEEFLGEYKMPRLVELERYVGATTFFNASVGRMFETRRGGHGMEVSDLGGGPVTIYSDDVSGVVEGSELIVCAGILRMKDGGFKVDARKIYVVGDDDDDAADRGGE